MARSEKGIISASIKTALTESGIEKWLAALETCGPRLCLERKLVLAAGGNH